MRRPASAPVFLIALDAGAAAPLHGQVYDTLRRAILDGRLTRGSRLPSSRALAAEIGIARNTVLEAFARLRAEGYVSARRGGGTRVRDTLPDAFLSPAPLPSARPRRSPRRAASDRPRPSAGGGEPHAPLRDFSAVAPAPPRVADRGRTYVATGAPLIRPDATAPVPFRLGLPALDTFPARLWARLEAQRWRAGRVRLGDGDPAGEPELRAAIASYVVSARGARCTADQVVVVSGAQQALDLCTRLLLDPGDAAWVEDPGYDGAHAALAAAGARIVPVPVDAEGLDVAAGARLAPDARLAYVTPSHQFPLGAVMSAPRRLALLAWARRASAWIVEDDYDSEFRYAGRPLPCLQGLDAERVAARGAASDTSHAAPARVCYVGTFSKTLAPGLRLGYLVVPDALVDAVRAARAAVDRHPPTLIQGVLADFVGDGHYARHLRRVRTLYAERQAALLAAAPALDGLLTLAPDPAGLHIVGWLPAGADDRRAAMAARRAAVEALPLSRFYARPAAGEGSEGGSVGDGRAAPERVPALLLGYAAFDAAAISDGVRRLRAALGPGRPSGAARGAAG